MNYRDLEIEEIKNGYVFDKTSNVYRCIFCGKTLGINEVYQINGSFLNALGAMDMHIDHEHGGVLENLIKLDKQITGLSEIQTDVLACLYSGMTTSEISKALDIAPPTVRTHNFNIQKLKTQAKVLLAILDLMEEQAFKRKQENQDDNKEASSLFERSYEEDKDIAMTDEIMQPFFHQYNLR